jgi:hypothetical protein
VDTDWAAVGDRQEIVGVVEVLNLNMTRMIKYTIESQRKLFFNNILHIYIIN